MRRIIIHAGFHKTGTTNLQQSLRVNRARLRPDIRLVLRPGMTALCESTRAYSKSREDYDLGFVKYEAAMLAESLQDEEATTIIICSEDLAGHMPGRFGLQGYGAAPDLMRALSVAFDAAAPDDELTFFFTSREAEPWLRSCYAQHLRAYRMVLDEADYLKRFKASADFAKVVDLVTREVPKSTVHHAALEDHSERRLGIAEALLDHLMLGTERRAAMIPSNFRNSALPDDVTAELLTLNRSGLEPKELRAAKQKLIEGAT